MRTMATYSQINRPLCLRTQLETDLLLSDVVISYEAQVDPAEATVGWS